MEDLDADDVDSTVALLKGVCGPIPLLGPIIGEVIGTTIPNQRLDRIAVFVKNIADGVKKLETDVAVVKAKVNSPEGTDIVEEGMSQVVRAISVERQRALANIVSTAIGKSDSSYAKAIKILHIFRTLTDGEFITLLFFNALPKLTRPEIKRLMDMHPKVLTPSSGEADAPKSERNRAAIQDSYRITLINNGLLKQASETYITTSLGKLLLAYLGDDVLQAQAIAE